MTPATPERWVTGPLPDAVNRAIERLASTDDVRRVAIMPDVHLSGEVCVGTVVATTRLIYPQAVGGDIGCGMAALRFDCEAGVIAGDREAARLLAGLYRAVPTLRRRGLAPGEGLPETLAGRALSRPALEKLKHRDGRVEFGTLGRGNHFLEFQSDPQGTLWLMVHSGSRAMGQAIREQHLQAARPAASGLRYLDAETAEGQAYLSDMAWASAYAVENRQALAAAAAVVVEETFGVTADPQSLFACNHNQVRREMHFGEELWVHRKGAISAAAGDPGIIPGSMGSPSYRVEGRGCERALCSSSHGAGRALSRAEAVKTITCERLHREMRAVWFDHRLSRALRDEAPSAYKDIQEVMRAQRDLTRIVRRLEPILCYKGT